MTAYPSSIKTLGFGEYFVFPSLSTYDATILKSPINKSQSSIFSNIVCSIFGEPVLSRVSLSGIIVTPLYNFFKKNNVQDDFRVIISLPKIHNKGK